ncbi:MAG TPA: DedA family protein [Thermoplasmata archaeon]|nr:DedA family protein [Thermoplasmata archaeon]
MTFSLIGSLIDGITLVLGTIGLPGLFALMVVESFGIPPIPSEVILPFAGFLVAEGTYPLVDATALALAGGLVGAFAAYAVGRWWRSRLIGWGLGAVRIRPEDLDRVDRWFAERGEATVAIARVVPIVRSYVSYPAGTARMSPVRFGAYTLLGSAPWTIGLLFAGVALGADWYLLEAYLAPLDYAFVALLVAGAGYVGLLAAGRITPGWPPRRRARASDPDPPAGPG